jgi:hypothetical protein
MSKNDHFFGISTLLTRANQHKEVAMCDIKYLKDIYIPPPGSWSKSGWKSDWLHPKHGPLPDLVTHWEYKKERFQVALWAPENSNHCVTMLELLHRRRTQEDELEALEMRGHILLSFRWQIKEGMLACCGRQYELPEGEDREWERKIYDMMMKQSVHLAVTTPIGSPTF